MPADGRIKLKTFEEKSRESYNKMAFDYDNTVEGRYTERFKELLLEEITIKSGAAILDVACGNGTLLKMLSGKGGIKGYGIDISDKMIEYAAGKYPDMSFSVGRCEKTPFSDRMFDAVTVCAAYHHFPDVRGFAKEVRRILKPQGMIYIAEIFYPFLIRTLLNPFVPLSKAGDVKFYAPKEIIGNFQSNGFGFKAYKRENYIQIIGMQKL
jgi:ubiquinone/menaquinone biosynthesis C-methylase UbiE